MIPYFKEKTRAGTVYQTQFDDGFVIWKLLPWSRYKVYRESRLTLGTSLDIEIEESVFEEAVIFSSYDEPVPPDVSEEEVELFRKVSRENLPAGIVSTVVKTILFMSGATKSDQIFGQLDTQRALISNIEDQIIVTICRAFPGYKPEEIEALDWPTVLKRAAQAEAMLLGQMVELPMQLAEPPQEEPEKLNIDDLLRENNGSYAQAPSNSAAENKKQINDLRAQYLRSRIQN